MSVLAIDIGGSGIRGARLAEGRLRHRVTQPLSPAVSRADLKELLARTILELAPGEHDTGAGVAFPGFLDGDSRVAPGIYVQAMAGLDLAAEVRELTRLEDVAVVPDLAAAALGEAWAVDNQGRLMCVGLGSGANSALVIRQDVLEVAGGALGDAGHVIVEPDGPSCRCGGRGCLESVCSGWAIARDGSVHGFDSAREVAAAARRGVESARMIFQRAGAALGRAVASWSAMTFPDRAVVVGGLAGAGELLLEPARRELRRVGMPAITAYLSLDAGVCGPDAALLGAACAAVAAGHSAASSLTSLAGRSDDRRQVAQPDPVRDGDGHV